MPSTRKWRKLVELAKFQFSPQNDVIWCTGNTCYTPVTQKWNQNGQLDQLVCTFCFHIYTTRELTHANQDKTKPHNTIIVIFEDLAQKFIVEFRKHSKNCRIEENRGVCECRTFGKIILKNVENLIYQGVSKEWPIDFQKYFMKIWLGPFFRGILVKIIY